MEQEVLIAGNILGTGATGSVYLAQDASGKSHALKTLRPGSEALWSFFESEVEFLSKLTHPRLVRIEGFSKNADGISGIEPAPCFWMEYIEGRNILEASRDSPDRVLDWLQQALEALAYLHGQSILHGDLKPANIMIDSEGQLKLLDFGLASVYEGDLVSSDRKTQGSVPYLAPEAIRGERISASDLFSLGTVFYQAIAGTHPREGAKNLAELFSRKIKPLRELVPGLPVRAARIVERMIEPDLRLRLGSAQEALRALQSESGASPRGETAAVHSFEMIGVGEHCRAIQDFVASLESASRPGVVLVHGLSGVGKSRFIRERKFELALQGFRVFDLPEDRAILPEVIPNRSVFVISNPSSLSATHLSDWIRYLRAENVCSLALVEYSDEFLTTAQLDFLRALRRASRVLDVPLAVLSWENSRRFLERVLGTDPPLDLSKAIFERTQGNPALLIEVARHLLDAGFDQHHRLSSAALRSLGFPGTITDIFSRRLEALSAEQQELLQPIATAHRPVSVALLEGLTGHPASHVRNQLAELVGRGVLREEQGRYRFSLREVKQQYLASLPAQCCLGWHRVWLKRIEGDLSFPLEARVHHALNIPDHPLVAAWSLQLCPELFKAERAELALSILQTLLPRLGDGETREAALRMLANAYGLLDRFADANRALDDWRKSYGPEAGLPLVKYWLVSAINFQKMGEPIEAGRRLRAAVAAADPTIPEQVPFLARAYSLLGLLELNAGEHAEAGQYFSRAERLLPEASAQRAEVMKHQARWYAQSGDWDAAFRKIGESVALYRKMGDGHGIFNASLERANLELERGDPSAAEAGYQEALRHAEQRQDTADQARALHNLGVLTSRQGRYGEAIIFLEDSKDRLALFGNPEEQRTNQMQLAIAYAQVGRFRQAEAEIFGLCADPSEVAFAEARAWLRWLKSGRIEDKDIASLQASIQARNASWDVEARLLEASLTQSPDLPERLRAIHRKLSDSHQITFEERGDWRRLILGENNAIDSKEAPAMDTLQKFSAINRELLATKDPAQVLERILDAALELSRAKRGYLVIRDSAEPVSSLNIKVARNIDRANLGNDRDDLSLSAVRKAIEQGEAVVTDNALQDARFENAASVHQLELRSILALPLKGTDGVIGALYLDHPFETDRFKGADLAILQSFADQAALALQKAQMIAELQSANRQLTQTVEVQETEISALKREVEVQREQLTYEYKEIIGRSPAMLEVLSLVDRITDTSVPVWIYGESGTGKEMIARALHFNSGRAKQAFVSENCSALPETLLESELFGHKKGSFTHADRDKKGLLEHAHLGTIFMDEIADMSLAMQAKLLRFLQEGEIRPLGSNQVIKVDVRVVSASNKDLSQLIPEGKFREDLYYRLNGITVILPPLRERIEDLPLLVHHFLKKFAHAEKRPPYEITADALEMIMSYPWPGNVRELENAIRTACLFHFKGKILPKSFHFKKNLNGTPSFAAAGLSGGKAKAGAAKSGGNIADEKRLLLQALYEHGYHKGHAAEALGISRRYLYTQMMRHRVPSNRIEMKAFIQEQLGLK